MSSKPMKAYSVSEDYDGNCVIVFATNSATARREGGNELNLSFEEVDSCRRAPWADQYTPGPVPMHAYLANGWWFECHHCGSRFDQSERNYGDDEMETPLEPVQSGRSVFCCPSCMMGDWAERRANSARQCATIEAAVVRWPMATGVTAQEYSSGSGGYEWRAHFTLPGIRYPVSWTLGESVVHVTRDDAEAFKTLYGAAT